MHKAADLGRFSNVVTTGDATHDELRTLCLLRDAGSVTQAEFATRHVALLAALGCRLSTTSPLLISGDDPYAEERAASW